VLTEVQTSFTLLGTPYLEYHPVVDLSSGRLLGMEALVRWQHPTEGRIPPDQLIPRAEASGDIGPLTRWILTEACEQAKRWSSSIQLGVNCTVHQLLRGDVTRAVAESLEETGFCVGQLTLEVTEDAIVDPDAAAHLKNLSQMGVQLSVDDVGTNWSSFELLKRNSISTLKIDGSFVAGLENSEGINRLVVETVIHMAHSLGMSAIVERIERAAQVDIVRGFGADAAQGFFFAQPMSGEDAAVFAGGPEIPQFSFTATKTLVRSPSVPAGMTLQEAQAEPATAGDPGPDIRSDDETDTASDTVTGSGEPDTVTGSDGEPDTVTGSDGEPDTVTGSDGETDTVTGSGAPDTVTGSGAPDSNSDPNPEVADAGAVSAGDVSEAVDAAFAQGAAWAEEVDSEAGQPAGTTTGPEPRSDGHPSEKSQLDSGTDPEIDLTGE
jgi:EAL domain-containing protein (putative c-di-GMP-specific phosphodiesterase class I)